MPKKIIPIHSETIARPAYVPAAEGGYDCRLLIAASRHPLAAALPFVGKAQRPQAQAVLAFYLEIRKALAQCSDTALSQAALTWWRQDNRKVFQAASVPEHPLNRLLQTLALPSDAEQLFDGILTAAQADLETVRYDSPEQLLQYCRRSGGALWRLFAGTEESAAQIESAGAAAQWAGLLRNVGADARRGRIYLPIRLMQRFDVPAQTVLRAEGGAAFEQLMRHEIEAARTLMQESIAAGLPKPLQIAAALVAALLDEIGRDGVGNVLKYQLSIPKPRCWRIALKTYCFGVRAK